MLRIKSFIAVALLPLCFAGCRGKEEKAASERLASVYTFSPEGNSDTSLSTHTSVIEEGRSVNVGFKTGGQIRRLTATEGAYVRKGQVIGYLDDTDYKLSLQQLETQYAQLESEARRIEEMHRRQNVSDNDYEKAMSGLAQLKTQLDLTKNKVGYTQLIAPVSGHVVKRYMEEGEMVGAGTPVFKIVDNAGLEAAVALSPSVYSRKDRIVRCVGRSSVTGNNDIPLDIISFIPEGDNNSLFKLRLKVPDAYRDRLLPGMNMRVEITYDSAEGTALNKIPSRALFERNGGAHVWVVNPADSTLSAREVRVVGVPENKFSMVEGVDASDEIVAVGVHHLSDGEKVKVIGKDTDIKKAAL